MQTHSFLQPPLRVCVIYEDNHRTQKLLKHIHETMENTGVHSFLQIDQCNLDEYENCIVALPTSDVKYNNPPQTILSRFSGSAFYRGNAGLQDISLLLCRAHTGQTTVLNGPHIIQLEDSKPLQMATLTTQKFLRSLSASCKNRVKLPCTVLMKHLTAQSIHRACSVIRDGKCMPQSNTPTIASRGGVVIKPAFGGGSKGVIILDVDPKTGQPPDERSLTSLVKEQTTGIKSSSRSWLMQRLVGDVDLQLRVEVVDWRVCYVVVIRKKTEDGSMKAKTRHQVWREAENLCLCEVTENVLLTLCPTPSALAEDLRSGGENILFTNELAESVFEYAQVLSRNIDAPVMAIEFKVESSGHAYVIDLNLNSNYNYETEGRLQEQNPRFVSSVECYIEMFIRSSVKNGTPEQVLWIRERMINDVDLSVAVPSHENEFQERATISIDGSPSTVANLLHAISNTAVNWNMQKRDWDSETTQHVLIYGSAEEGMYQLRKALFSESRYGYMFKIFRSSVTHLVSRVELQLK